MTPPLRRVLIDLLVVVGLSTLASAAIAPTAAAYLYPRPPAAA